MTNLTTADTKTPWCSKCKGYTDFSENTVGTSERGYETLRYCSECKEEMWSVMECRGKALAFKLLALLVIGVNGYAMYAVHNTLVFVGLPVVSAIGLVALYYKKWDKPAKHLKEFKKRAGSRSWNSCADRK